MNVSHLQEGGRVRSPFVPYAMNLTRQSVMCIVSVDVRFEITEYAVVWIIGRDDQGWGLGHGRRE